MQTATGTIDMQGMRYLNLFNNITKVNTRYFFSYNNILYFLVPKHFLRKALGKDGENIRKISYKLGKRIRIIPIPQGEQHIKDFIQTIVNPVEIGDVSINGNEVVLTATRQNKAALIGRDKRRLIEMQKIIKNFFGKEFRIV